VNRGINITQNGEIRGFEDFNSGKGEKMAAGNTRFNMDYGGKSIHVTHGAASFEPPGSMVPRPGINIDIQKSIQHVEIDAM